VSRERAIELVALCLILVVAASLRWYGLGWDSGYLFHPDERQIVLIISSLQLPTNPLEFFSPGSPLNPHFFAYGSLPIYLLRLLIPFAPPTNIVGPWADDQLARWVLFGRAISGAFDLGTIVLTYALGRRMYDGRVGLIAAACVAVTVLHIQLSHFYAVDTLLTFLILATIYAAFRVAQKAMWEAIPDPKGFQKTLRVWNGWLIICGICFGLGLATKITALPLIFPIGYACYLSYAREIPFRFSRERIRKIWRAARRPFLEIIGIALLVFVVTQPYALIDWYTFGRDVIRETFVARGWLDYPYTRQYANTLPFVYQIMQSSIWGMGLPLGIFAWGGGAIFIYQWWKTREWRDLFLLFFTVVYFFTIGAQYAKYLRYLLPLLPVLYLMAVCAWLRVLANRRAIAAFGVGIVLLASLVYSIAFVQIYGKEHPWLTASRWIYENVAAGKSLIVEQWDDALPTLIQFPNGARRASDYTQIVLPMYDEDTDAKGETLAHALAQSDVVILASQRLYGSIGKLPSRYPMTTRYYEKLFNGELGFEPVMTARNDPNLFGITIRDDPREGLAFDASSVDKKFAGVSGDTVWNWGFADESFSVYDHPQPIIFQKVRTLSVEEIEQQLRQGP